MTSSYNRRVRIEGKYDSTHGLDITITDIDTGEAITNVCKAVITLIAGEYNAVELTYFPTDSEGKTIGNVPEQMKRLNAPEIAITAVEHHEVTLPVKRFEIS